LFYHLKRAKRFNEEHTMFYTAEIILALEFSHKNNIIYRDLKPENVLLDSDGHIKLTDLELSKEGVIFNNEKTYTFCDTPEYLAPEIIKGDGHGKEVDWWSLGILIYEMLNGRAPFVSRNRQEVLKSILQKRIEMKSFLSPEARSFLRKLLCVDPSKRLGASRNAEEIKSDPFFK
jgi:serine/threonine protein kinase